MRTKLDLEITNKKDNKYTVMVDEGKKENVSPDEDKGYSAVIIVILAVVVLLLAVILLVIFTCANKICTVIKEETSRYNVIILLIVCMTIIAVCCAVIFIAKSVTHLKQKKLDILKETLPALSEDSFQYKADIYKAFSTSVSEV